MVAWSSRLPQSASTALAVVLKDHGPDAIKVAGPGLLDSARLALSSFDLRADIPETNQAQISTALDAYIRKLQSLRSNLEAEFAKGSVFARSLRQRA
jgi:prephenate dehydrogenase